MRMKRAAMCKNGTLATMAVLFITLFLLTGFIGDTAEAKNSGGKDAILIGYVSAFTGPLAQFTQSIKFIEKKALDVINKDGGIYIEEYGKKLPVKVIYADSQSNPVKAMEVANKLILSNKVDFLVGAWTPDHINPVSAAAERNKIPALMENGPMASWLTGGPYSWAFGNLFSLEKMVDVYIDAWDTVKTNKKVGFIYDSNVDGVLLSKMNREKAEARGYKIFDPGRFPFGTQDFSSVINQFKREGVDIVVANMITPDFAVCWKQFHQLGFVPKIFTIGKGAHFTTDIMALGSDLGHGLLREDLWDATFQYTSSLTGQTAAELTREFEAATGKYGDCTIGYDMSTFEVINDVFTRAKSVDREKVRKALAETNIDGIYGHIQYNKQNIAEVPVVVSQWKKGEDGKWGKNIISNGAFKNISEADEKLFFLPGSK